MKKVLGVALVAAILVAALPTTAGAAVINRSNKNCVAGSFLLPCRAPMPPSSRGGNGTGTVNGGSKGNGTSSRGTGSSQGSGHGALPPGPISGR